MQIKNTAVAAALLAVLVLAGCSKKEEAPVAAPAATETAAPAADAAPAPAPAPAKE